MTNTKWTLDGGIYFPINGNIVLHTTPGPGIWAVTTSPDPMDLRLGLTKVADKFEFNFKIYELGHEAITKKIKTIWNSEKFIETDKNLGIVLNGTKGTGKTIAAKLMCNDIDIPVIIVNGSFSGRILPFIQQLNFECIVLIDEAEKSFKQDGDDEILLKLIDGVYNSTRKLYILTTNRLTINENLLGRPGRIRYIQEFKNLPLKAVSDYIDDNLIDKSKKERVLQEVDLLEISTIDILKSIVEEVNIFGDLEESNLLNIPKAKYVFDVAEFEGCNKSSILAIKLLMTLTKKSEQDLYTWFNSPIDSVEFLKKINESEARILATEELANSKKIERAKEDLSDNNSAVFKAAGELNNKSVAKDQSKDAIPLSVVLKCFKDYCISFIDDSSEKSNLADADEKVGNAKVAKVEKEKENVTSEVIYIRDIISTCIAGCSWCGKNKMTNQYSSLWKEMETSLGTIVEVPDDSGFFILRGKWSGEESLYLILRQKNNPSLYRGGLDLL